MESKLYQYNENWKVKNNIFYNDELQISLENISYSQEEVPLKACSNDPVFDWGLEDFMDKDKVKNLLPPGYRLCLWKTSFYLKRALHFTITKRTGKKLIGIISNDDAMRITNGAKLTTAIPKARFSNR